MSEIGRRQFLSTVGTAAVGGLFHSRDARAQMMLPEKPGVIRPGYAAITWGGNDAQAIDEIADVGFKGIQLRASAFDTWGKKPETLRTLLEKRGLTFVALSSGNLNIDPGNEQQQIDLHLQHAAFVRDAGGKLIQVIDEKPKGRAVTADDYRRLGRLLNEIGGRTAKLGVPLVYHHHMNSIGETPAAIDAVLGASDAEAVGLLLDIAHYTQGGGDPIQAIRRYYKRIRLVHLKDVVATPDPPGYRWVELGKGRVNVKGSVAGLRAVRYDGWAIVELDRVDPPQTPKSAAIGNRDFVVNELKLAL